MLTLINTNRMVPLIGPIGLDYLAAAVQRAGIDVEVVDLALANEPTKAIEEYFSARETEKFVVEGSRIFHSAQLLRGTVGVSCDMCIPHAANTHPETYPKFQSQLGHAALLRNMINWCIEHPVRGKRLGPDDPRMRALEAYITAQRSGTVMNYGKH